MSSPVSYGDSGKLLSQGAVAPAYYFFGPLDVLKDEAVAGLLDRVLDPSLRDFNYDQRSAAQLQPEDVEQRGPDPGERGLAPEGLVPLLEQVRVVAGGQLEPGVEGDEREPLPGPGAVHRPAEGEVAEHRSVRPGVGAREPAGVLGRPLRSPSISGGADV